MGSIYCTIIILYVTSILSTFSNASGGEVINSSNAIPQVSESFNMSSYGTFCVKFKMLIASYKMSEPWNKNNSAKTWLCDLQSIE